MFVGSVEKKNYAFVAKEYTYKNTYMPPIGRGLSLW